MTKYYNNNYKKCKSVMDCNHDVVGDAHHHPASQFSLQQVRPEDKVVRTKGWISQWSRWIKHKGQLFAIGENNSSMNSSSEATLAPFVTRTRSQTFKGSNWGWNWRLGDIVYLLNTQNSIGKIRWIGFVGSSFSVGVEFINVVLKDLKISEDGKTDENILVIPASDCEVIHL